MSILDGLNPAQRKAASVTAGPVLILAGAGSGKTRTLTHRLAHLIDQGVPPWRILAVTFTNKAAQEMKERVRALVGPSASQIWMGTFHSVCGRILRQEAGSIGLDSSFTIYDTDDSKTLMRRIYRRRGLDEKVIKTSRVREAISKAKNDLQSPEDYAREHNEQHTALIAELYAEYQTEMGANNAVDFDDLLLLPVRLFAEHPDVLAAWQSRFDHLLIDEYQDTNHAQYLLVKNLAAGHHNVCAVGDDDQSIYGWRGADIQNILDFEKDYSDAEVIRLEQNYRSTATILKAAGAVVENNSERKGKELWTEGDEGGPIVAASLDDERAEASWIGDKIRALRADGKRYGDIAILYRTNAQSRAIEESFVRASMAIPYAVVGGLRFYERKEVKDILCYLRVVDNPSDMLSLRRIINVPKRGVGDRTVQMLAETAEEHDVSLLDVMRDPNLVPVSATSKQGTAIRHLVELIDGFVAERESLPAHEMINRVVQESGYLASLRAEATVEAETREQHLDELLGGATSFAEAAQAEGRDTSVSGFLQEVSLITDIDTWEDEADAVTLMTLHSAKGLEFPAVFIAGMEEDLFPLGVSMRGDEEIEEERRLFYVGLTRAEEFVFLSQAQRRRRYNEYLSTMPSRFLDEIPEITIEWERSPRRGTGAPTGVPGLVGGASPIPRPLGGGSRSAPARRVEAPNHDDAAQEMPNYDDISQVVEDFFEVGRFVVHPTFGRGKIVKSENPGPDVKLTIQFERRITKKLIARMAQLEPCP